MAGGKHTYQRGITYDVESIDGFVELIFSGLSRYTDAHLEDVYPLITKSIQSFWHQIMVPKLRDYAPEDQHNDTSLKLELDSLGTVEGTLLTVRLPEQWMSSIVGVPPRSVTPPDVMVFIAPSGEKVFTQTAQAGISDSLMGRVSGQNSASYRTNPYSGEQGTSGSMRETWISRASDTFRRSGVYGSFGRILAIASAYVAFGDYGQARATLSGLITGSAVKMRASDLGVRHEGSMGR